MWHSIKNTFLQHLFFSKGREQMLDLEAWKTQLAYTYLKTVTREAHS